MTKFIRVTCWEDTYGPSPDYKRGKPREWSRIIDLDNIAMIDETLGIIYTKFGRELSFYVRDVDKIVERLDVFGV